MKTSVDGLHQIMRREGTRLTAYQDSVGVWTIGTGHTAAAGPPAPVRGMEISAAEAQALLARDIMQYEAAVNRAITRPMTQPQFDAYVSLCYNIGPGAFMRSTTARLFNSGNATGAADAFMGWCTPPELRGRREAERAQFLTLAPMPMPRSAQKVLAASAPVVVVAAAEAVKAAGGSAVPLLGFVSLASGLSFVILIGAWLFFRLKATAHFADFENAAKRPAPIMPQE